MRLNRIGTAFFAIGLVTTATTSATTSASAQQPFDGTWNVTVQSPMGAQKSVVTLKNDGGALTGTAAGESARPSFRGAALLFAGFLIRIAMPMR